MARKPLTEEQKAIKRAKSKAAYKPRQRVALSDSERRIRYVNKYTRQNRVRSKYAPKESHVTDIREMISHGCTRFFWVYWLSNNWGIKSSHP